MLVGKEDKRRKHSIVVRLLVGSSILGICDAMAWFFRGNESTTGYYMVRISNYLVFFLFYIYGLLVADHLMACLYDVKKKFWDCPKWCITCKILCFIGIAMYTTNLAHPFLYTFDDTNHYYRLDLFISSQVVGIITILIFLVVVFENAKKLSDEEVLSNLFLAVLPILSIVIMMAYYGISLTYLSMMLASLACFVEFSIERAKLNDRKYYEIKEQETALMMSQVTPHFIFNSLAAIRSQVLEDPDEAYDTIGEFARFLRSNLNSKRLEGTVSLEEELDSTWVYIKLEKLRFGEKLQVDLDVEDDTFQVPAMSVQTMVENAIKHGIKPKGEGNIWITEREEDGFHVIRIKDDGEGFDVSQAPTDAKEHIGLNSTKERIRYSCKGNVEVKSTIGEGTEIIISIPVDKAD